MSEETPRERILDRIHQRRLAERKRRADDKFRRLMAAFFNRLTVIVPDSRVVVFPAREDRR